MVFGPGWRDILVDGHDENEHELGVGMLFFDGKMRIQGQRSGVMDCG